MATRNTVFDFIRDVNAQTNAAGTIVYSATLNADGSVKITRNGVVLYSKVLWQMGTGGAITDTNQRGDRVLVQFADNTSVGSADAQVFIQSLV